MSSKTLYSQGSELRCGDCPICKVCALRGQQASDKTGVALPCVIDTLYHDQEGEIHFVITTYIEKNKDIKQGITFSETGWQKEGLA